MAPEKNDRRSRSSVSWNAVRMLSTSNAPQSSGDNGLCNLAGSQVKANSGPPTRHGLSERLKVAGIDAWTIAGLLPSRKCC